LGVSERFACRMTGQHARGEGWTVNHRIQRLWRDEGLRVPQRRRRKRLGISTSPTVPAADAPNRVWAVDLQFDATTDGRPVKIVSIVDEHTRECLGGLVGSSITADDLIDELDRLAADPATRWLCAATTDPNWPARRWRIGPANASACIHPTRRAVAQRLHRVVQRPHPRRMPQHNLFWSLAHARVVIADWKDDDNHRRRHSALCYQPPAVYAASSPTDEIDSYSTWLISRVPPRRTGSRPWWPRHACRARTAGARQTSNQLPLAR
jgi:putative transposase